MGRCKHCGGHAIMFSDICSTYWDHRAMEIAATRAQSKTELTRERVPQELEPMTFRAPQGGSESACIGLGVILAIVSIYFLVVSPGAEGAEALGGTIVNLQRLTIGETSGIASAVFLAAGMRPR